MRRFATTVTEHVRFVPGDQLVAIAPPKKPVVTQPRPLGAVVAILLSKLPAVGATEIGDLSYEKGLIALSEKIVINQHVAEDP